MTYMSGEDAKRLYDTRRSWLVCASSFLVQFIIFGVHSSYGIFFVAIQEEFQERESATAWVGSQAFGLMFFLGPLTTALCEHFRSRIVTCVGGILSFVGLLSASFVTDFAFLYLTYGFLWGVGTSFCYFASLVVLPSYFRKYLSLAYGLAIAGAGTGVPPMAWAINQIVLAYGWRITMRVLAGLCLLFCACSLSYGLQQMHNIQLQSVVQQKRSSQSSSLHIIQRLRIRLLEFLSPSPWKNRAFIVWSISLGLIGFGNFTPLVFLISIANDIGISSTKSALLIGYQAITQTLARVIFGKLGDNPRVSKVTLVQVIGLLHALNTTLCPLAKSYGSLVVYVVVLGLCDGCLAVMFGMGTFQIVGEKLMARALGNLCCAVAIGNVAGPPVAGFIFHVFGTFDIAFYLSGGLMTFGVCLLFLVPWLLRKEAKPCEEKSVLLREHVQTTKRETDYKRASINVCNFPSDAAFLTGFYGKDVLQQSVSIDTPNTCGLAALTTSTVHRASSTAANFFCANSLNGSSGYGSHCPTGDGSVSRASGVIDKGTEGQCETTGEEKPVITVGDCKSWKFPLEERETLTKSEIATSLDEFSVLFEELLEKHNVIPRVLITETFKETEEYLRCVEPIGDSCFVTGEVESILESCRETTL